VAKTDRAFRALSRQEPEIIAALLRAVKPGLISPRTTLVPDDVAPTHVDALPPELDADWVVRVNQDEVLHVECQGYRDVSFSERALWYHLGLALRYRNSRRVRTAALWLVPLAESQREEIVQVHDISVRMTMIDLTRVSAARLLEDDRTACFAAGADAGNWTNALLCQKIAAILVQRRASWAERHMAVVAAAMRKRYDAMVSAMEQANLEPVIIEDLVRIGEDIGFDRGVDKERRDTYARLFKHRLGRALTPEEITSLEQRCAHLRVERLDDVLFNLNKDALAAWLADPSAK
jgi:hypothetical protein